VASTSGGVQLTMAKQDVQELPPPVEIDHAALTCQTRRWWT